MNNIIGIHYELPNGKIARTYGWNGVDKTVRYYFDDGKGARTATQAEFDTWKPRRDLEDFPNARDPKLPYVFDLLWDIKYMSELRRELVDHDDRDAIMEQIRQHNIEL